MRQTLPRRVFRNEHAFRRAATGLAAAMINCGFMLKPDGAGGYIRRRMDCFVGVLVLRGSGTFTDWHGRSQRVGAGSFIQHPPDLPHGVQPDPDGDWAEFYFTIPTPLWQTLVDLGTVRQEPAVLQPGVDAQLVEGFESLLNLLRHAAERDAGPVLARAHDLLARVYRLDATRRGNDRPHASAIDEACAQLGANLAVDVDLRSLAHQASLSYERFRKVFREQVGVPPAEYRIRRRIDQARHLIAMGGMSNKQVAYALGYADPFVFSRQFRRYVGMSPRQFRQSLA